MRRTHLRGHENILKRVFVHTSAFNLGLLMRRLLGAGTPRRPQGRLVAALLWLIECLRAMLTSEYARWPNPRDHDRFIAPIDAESSMRPWHPAIATCTTGC
jgi:hypothetical protein